MNPPDADELAAGLEAGLEAARRGDRLRELEDALLSYFGGARDVETNLGLEPGTLPDKPDANEVIAAATTRALERLGNVDRTRS